MEKPWKSGTAIQENKKQNDVRGYGGHENSSDALVPPKPKEFEMAARIGIFFDSANGMNAPSNSGSGCSRLSVGGATPWRKKIHDFGHCNIFQSELMISN
jgi:hypothetical protein